MTTTTSTPRRHAARATSRAGPAHRSTGQARRRRHEEVTASPFIGRRPKKGDAGSRRKSNKAKAKDKPKAKKKRSPRKAQPAVTGPGERNAALLTATVLWLTLFGLVMLLSASMVEAEKTSDDALLYFKRQGMWAALGGMVFLLTSRINYRVLRRLGTPMLLVTTGLLLLVFIPGIGVSSGGAARWIGYGGYVVQPSELAKLVFVIWIADLLTRRERRMDRPELTVRPVMVVLVMVSALIVAQPKLGTPIIMAIVALLMLFVAGARMRSLFCWIAAGATVATVLAFLEPYRRTRLLAFLNPWADPKGSGYQLIQSQISVASGGWLGSGLGAGAGKWGFVPEAWSDFIFAIVAEEIGLIGASALIGGYLLVGWCGFRTALLARDRFGTLLAAGITCWLLVQAFLNIGIVLGVMPTTGEPLPFVSAGGSSLVTALAATGLLVGISRKSA